MAPLCEMVYLPPGGCLITICEHAQHSCVGSRLIGVQEVIEGAEHTTLRCSCVQGQGGRSDGPHGHHLVAV